MAYIKIPRIDVNLPIYHGTDSEHMLKGVGHLVGTSLPVGGNDTHSVLSAHSGLSSADLFTNLANLDNGDLFYIYVLDEILAYEVDNIKVVKPTETDDLRIVKGEDYITLVTCTPFGINSHRLLVRGHRVEYIVALTIIGFLIGLGIFLYPHISSWMINNEVRDAIEEFKTNSSLAYSKQKDALYQAMMAYNETLYLSGQSEISDAWTFKQEEFKFNDYDYKNNAVATITIPKMELEMPIYLGATKENMSRGIVNLGNTSLPIGGKNTNCVLAGHRGYRGAAFFRNIEDLQIGDEIIIDNYWEQLKYNVYEIKVIYPTESEQVLIQEGKDMLTLITCHPYRNNYQRYVVYCRRSNEFDDSIMIPNKDNSIISSKRDIAVEQNLPYIMLAVLGIGIIVVYLYKRRAK